MSEGLSEPVLSLPTGGGALAGLGETFAPDLHTGTGNVSVPLQLPAGRGGFQPQLNLSYSTGHGTGLFGMGWSLPVPGVSRGVSGGVPTYDDLADTFVLSGAEELVRVAGGYPGTARYRPRTEGLFALVEHVRDGVENYWRVRSTDGRTSWYGTPRPAAAPAGWTDPAVVRNLRSAARHPAEWRLTRTTDPYGNEIRYTYGARDAGTDGPHHWDQPLLTEVAYADHGDRDDSLFAVRVTLDYEVRPDPVSDYRSGFERRTTRRCRAIRVATHTDAVRPVREYRLGYRQDAVNGTSLLERFQVVGFDDAGQPVEELPALDLGYTAFDPARRRFQPAGGDQLPANALRGDDFALVDLSGGGLPDLVELTGSIRYWRNLGAGRFDRPRTMSEAPSTGRGGVTLLDADGDGRADLVVNRSGLSGYFPLTDDGGWDRRSFRAHPVAPSFDPADPEVRLVDLDGDGVTDAIRSGSRLECFFNHREKGWHASRAVERAAAAVFPDVRFSDPRVRLADLTGDGLQDIVLIHDRNIEYWPNLGRGDWGARVSMLSAPELPVGYDPQRVHLGDLDGDGAADLVYVDDGRVLVWFNQGGNRWTAAPVVITGTPPLARPDAVRIADLLGNGTDQVVWSVDAPSAGAERLWLLDLTGGTKPYLLNRLDNGIGAISHLSYASSTRFYLADRLDPATRWWTPLPIPVQVVAAVETVDAISGGRLSTKYRYHHGYWDGAERELRGFGLVDQLDTETTATGDVIPLLTRTWFHQGAVGDETSGWHEWDGSGEHWAGDANLLGHRAGVSAFVGGLPVTTGTRRARRDALRALRGRILRTELYAVDGTTRADRPYTVTERAYDVRLVTEDGAEPALVERPTADQLPVFPVDDPRRPVFATFEVAARVTQWERGDDPMTRLTFAADHDNLARPRRRTEIGCPRGWRAMGDSAAGAVVTRALTTFARPIDPAVVWLFDRVALVTGLAADGTGTVPGLRELGDSDPAFELTGQTVHHYDGDAFTGLPCGQIGAFGTLVRTEQLMLTEAIVAAAYGADVPPYLTKSGPVEWTVDYPTAFRTALPVQAGYRWHEGDGDQARGWWVETKRLRFDFHDPARVPRGLRLATRPALGADGPAPDDRDTVVEHDAFGLFPVRVTDPAGLTTTVELDYRVWQPRLSTDPNGTTQRFAFTPLGRLAASWTTGAAGEGDLDAAGITLAYDLRAYVDRGEPISVHATHRVHADGDPDAPAARRDETIEKRDYSDGFGRLLQARTRTGDTRFGDLHTGDGLIPSSQDGVPGPITGRTRAAGDPVNVKVSGWQTYDVKGRPLERYEPYYDQGWAFAPPVAAQLGARVRLAYDARGRVERTVAPDGSEERVVPGLPADLSDPDAAAPTPWLTTSYDANDNAARTHGPGAPVPAHHLDTPATVECDPAGRPVETVTRNRMPGEPIDELRTRQVYDRRGNRVELIDALGRTALRSVHDLTGRALRTEGLDTGTKVLVIDAAGNPVEARDGRGAVVLRLGDRGGRPAAVWARDDAAGAVTLRERMAYGDGGTPDQPAAERAANRARYQLGKLVTHHDEAGRLDFDSYDHRGNLRSRTRRVISDAALAAGWVADWAAAGAEDALDPVPLTWEQRHDALDRTTLTRYPTDADGTRKELRPEYDESGGLRRVTLDGDVYVDRIVRNARGQRTLIVYGNGIAEASAHDAATAQLLRVWSGRASAGPDGWTPTGAPLRDTAWRHDLIGNTIAVRERSPGTGVGVTPDALDRSLAYDACYQLIASDGRECDTPPPAQPWANGPGCTDPTATRRYAETYRYDRAGNLAEVTRTAAGGGFTKTFTLDSNRLTNLKIGQATFDYTYDPAGNLIGETTSRHFEWDHAGRLRGFRIQAGAGPVSVRVRYLYDATGQRVKRFVVKQAGGSESSVTLDGGSERHTIGGVTSSTLHVMDDRRRVATVRVGPALQGDGAADTPVAYHLGDELDSSTVVVGGATAAAADAVRREEYGVWGETTYGSYARKRYRFAGKECDEASGLYGFGARHYAPWLGRWVSADPAGPVDGLNLFAYARNNPVSRTDPSGTDSAPADDGYRDAGAGPTDVSGAGAQSAAPPTSTQDTASGSPPSSARSTPGIDPHSLPDAKNTGVAVAAVGGLIRGVPLPPGGGAPPAFTPGAGVQLPGTGWNGWGYAPGAPGAGPVSAPGVAGGAPVSAPGAAGAAEGAIAPGAAGAESAIAPGASSALGDSLAVAGEVAGGAAIVATAGLTIPGHEPLPQAPPTPTSAELDQAFVRIAQQQNARLEQAVRNWDFSLIAAYQPGRMRAIMRFAQSAPWAAISLLHMAYGKTLELMIDDALQIDDVAGGYFGHLGGKNQADWQRSDGVLYDVCTTDTAAEHTCRFYGERMRIFEHRGLPEFAR